MNQDKRNKRAKRKAKSQRTAKAGAERGRAELRKLVTKLVLDSETGEPGELHLKGRTHAVKTGNGRWDQHRLSRMNDDHV